MQQVASLQAEIAIEWRNCWDNGDFSGFYRNCFLNLGSVLWLPMQDAPFTLFEPVQRSSCVVFAAPHSGRHYAPEFLAQSVLDSHAIRASEDAFVDQLFEPAVQFGAPLLVANAPRAYVDLNRACDELDPAVIEGVKSLGRECKDCLGSRGCAAGRGDWHTDLSRKDQPCRGARAHRPHLVAISS